MAIIEAIGLRKVFRSIDRQPGLGGAIGALFSRTYVEKVAVDSVDFALQPGELVGYIGPNGAGKSTTIKMLTGILVPTSGTLRVAGIVPHAHRMANAVNIGVVFGQRSQLYWDLPLRESFELLRSIYDVPRERYLQNMKHFADILDLDRFLSTPVRQLSLGERMRGDFAAAMLHDPKIVYLDEPTIGLDVVAKEAIRAFIGSVNRERGTTVILTTHDLADVERLCRRLILIAPGHVLYDGGVEQLKAKYAPHRILVVKLAAEAVTEGRSVLIDASIVPGAEIIDQADGVARIQFETARTPVQDLIAAVNARYPVADLSIVEPDLEGVVRQIYNERVPVA
jgi:ABC-2 type transport system ATP-binding protein